LASNIFGFFLPTSTLSALITLALISPLATEISPSCLTLSISRFPINSRKFASILIAAFAFLLIFITLSESLHSITIVFQFKQVPAIFILLASIRMAGWHFYFFLLFLLIFKVPIAPILWAHLIFQESVILSFSRCPTLADSNAEFHPVASASLSIIIVFQFKQVPAIFTLPASIRMAGWHFYFFLLFLLVFKVPIAPILWVHLIFQESVILSFSRCPTLADSNAEFHPVASASLSIIITHPII